MAYSNTTAYTYTYLDMKDYLYQAILYQLMSSGMAQIRVFKSDPLDQAQIPAIGINKVNTDEDSSGLGLFTRQPDYNDATKTYTAYTGAYMRETIEVRIFHTNADERDTLGIFTLATLFALREDLLKAGIADIRLSGGRDEQDNALMAQPLYMNSITLSYLNPLEVGVSQTVAGLITSVPVTETAPKLKNK